jgi:hypothetical protein
MRHKIFLISGLLSIFAAIVVVTTPVFAEKLDEKKLSSESKSELKMKQKKITGKVFECDTQRSADVIPLAGAQIKIEALNTTPSTLSLTSDESGKFQVALDPSLSYNITASKSGYSSETLTYKYYPESDSQLALTLVQNGKECRQTGGGGGARTPHRR